MENDICMKGNNMEQGSLTWNRFKEEQIKAESNGCRKHVKCNNIFVYYYSVLFCALIYRCQKKYN